MHDGIAGVNTPGDPCQDAGSGGLFKLLGATGEGAGCPGTKFRPFTIRLVPAQHQCLASRRALIPPHLLCGIASGITVTSPAQMRRVQIHSLPSASLDLMLAIASTWAWPG
jgi:hypothetical protein